MQSEAIDLNEILVGPTDPSFDAAEWLEVSPDFRDEGSDELETVGAHEFDDFGGGGSPGYAAGGLLEPTSEENLALDLLNVATEAEMEEFLGKVLGSAARAVRSVGKRVVPQAGRVLKGPARQLLSRAAPLLGSAAGSVVPGVGTALGGAAGSMVGSMLGGRAAGGGRPSAGSLLGLGSLGLGPGGAIGSLLGGEMELASDEEARLDLARRLVRSLGQAAGDAISDPAAFRDPVGTAAGALRRAVQTHLPAPLRQALADGEIAGAAASGRWVRQGPNIVLYGV